jgi:hypothetical protein
MNEPLPPKPTESDAPPPTAPNQPSPTTISQVDAPKEPDFAMELKDVSLVPSEMPDTRAGSPFSRRVDAPKDDARTWFKSKGYEDCYVYVALVNSKDGHTVRVKLSELLEAYALPFQQQRDAAQAEVKRLFNLPGFNEGRHIGKMVAAGCSIDFSNNELFVRNERAERAESESAALRQQLQELKCTNCGHD